MEKKSHFSNISNSNLVIKQKKKQKYNNSLTNFTLHIRDVFCHENITFRLCIKLEIVLIHFS